MGTKVTYYLVELLDPELDGRSSPSVDEVVQEHVFSLEFNDSTQQPCTDYFSFTKHL